MSVVLKATLVCDSCGVIRGIEDASDAHGMARAAEY
jgi:hypothetical protein